MPEKVSLSELLTLMAVPDGLDLPVFSYLRLLHLSPVVCLSHILKVLRGYPPEIPASRFIEVVLIAAYMLVAFKLPQNSLTVISSREEQSAD